MIHTLPAAFTALEPYVARFAVAGTANRAQLRSDTSDEERQAFHAAAKDLVAPALDLLDNTAFADMDAAQNNLLNLCLTFAHIALAVEIQSSDEPRHAQMRSHMRITRSPADAIA